MAGGARPGSGDEVTRAGGIGANAFIWPGLPARESGLNLRESGLGLRIAHEVEVEMSYRGEFFNTGLICSCSFGGYSSCSVKSYTCFMKKIKLWLIPGQFTMYKFTENTDTRLIFKIKILVLGIKLLVYSYKQSPVV